MASITITPEIEALLKDCMGEGDFHSPEEAIVAGLASLRSQQHSGDFAPGELERMLSSAEERLKREGPIPASVTRDAIAHMSLQRRKRA